MPKSEITIEFIGSGSSSSEELGNSCAVINIFDTLLCIDFGFTAYHAFKKRYNKLPDAVYITHLHLDHIGGLQSLFYDAYFSADKPIKLFVHCELVKGLTKIMNSLGNMLAEGGGNFFDAFQLCPADEHFWYGGFKFNMPEARHQADRFCYGLSLKGRFYFTGDTKPIPEVINTHASQGEVIFHDLSLQKQPSHTFMQELTSYSPNVIGRLLFYHLHSKSDELVVIDSGFNTVELGKVYTV